MDSEILAANISSIKGTYDCKEIAERFGETYLYQEGDKWRGRCPIHNGESPAFHVYPDGQGRFTRWQCFRCNQGGDVLDLYDAIYGPFRNVLHTIGDFADRFGLKLWREEDFLTTNQIMVKRGREHAQKLLNKYFSDVAYRTAILPYLWQIEDEDQRAQENERCLKILGLA